MSKEKNENKDEGQILWVNFKPVKSYKEYKRLTDSGVTVEDAVRECFIIRSAFSQANIPPVYESQ